MLACASADGPRPEGSWVGAVGLAWVALVGIPRSQPERSGATVAWNVASALPLFAVAVVLDLQAGSVLHELEIIAAVLLLSGGVLTLAAHGSGRPRIDMALGLGWLLLVIALPALSAVLAWNDAPGGGPVLLEYAAQASPLQLAFDTAAAGVGSRLAFVGPLLFSLVLLQVVRFAGRPRQGHDS